MLDNNFEYVLIAVSIMAILTLILRFLPFILFSKKTPELLIYLGLVLPYSIMAMLVIYCLKNINFSDNSKFLPEFISLLIVVVLHKWKHNTLLSIVVGTVSYMYLVQNFFN
ncbi:MAG: AzlD domain-containing protein [Fusobacterium gastrosuis]|nr:AzlD domain-containing protein [Fusobacterium gastrosuis]